MRSFHLSAKCGDDKFILAFWEGEEIVSLFECGGIDQSIETRDGLKCRLLKLLNAISVRESARYNPNNLNE